jgi:exosortase K
MRWAAWLLPVGLLGIAAAVKLAAMTASVGVHRVFLYPLVLLLSVYTGEGYDERAGQFYFSDFFLDFSCAGINFFVIAAITTAWLFPEALPWPSRFKLVPARILLHLGFLTAAVYAVTLAANFLRVAIFLNLQPFAIGRAWLHEAVGIAVFLSLLISYSLLLYRIKNAQQPSNP